MYRSLIDHNVLKMGSTYEQVMHSLNTDKRITRYDQIGILSSASSVALQTMLQNRQCMSLLLKAVKCDE